MSDANVLLGFITEPRPGLHEDRSAFARHNDAVLAELTVDDDWPQLCKTMFAVTGEDWKHGSYGNQRVIHFAGRFNHLGDSLHEWLTKFERLLRRLIWQNASVFLLETWSAQEVRLSYRVGPSAIAKYCQSPPMPPDEWEFSGINLTPPESRAGGDFLAELLKRRTTRSDSPPSGPAVA